MDHALLPRLKAVGQQHLLAFWDRLDPQAQQQLAAQIEAIDWDQFARLRSEHGGVGDQTAAMKQHWRALAERSLPPPAVRLGKEPQGFTRAQARAAGEQALQSGKVGMILV